METHKVKFPPHAKGGFASNRSLEDTVLYNNISLNVDNMNDSVIKIWVGSGDLGLQE